MLRGDLGPGAFRHSVKRLETKAKEGQNSRDTPLEIDAVE